MSEQKSNYQAELDTWMQANVIGPLSLTDPNQGNWECGTNSQIKQTVRAKVLASYRNGQAAGPRTFQPRQYPAQTAHLRPF
jgi:hypothetical protein